MLPLTTGNIEKAVEILFAKERGLTVGSTPTVHQHGSKRAGDTLSRCSNIITGSNRFEQLQPPGSSRSSCRGIIITVDNGISSRRVEPLVRATFDCIAVPVARRRTAEAIANARRVPSKSLAGVEQRFIDAGAALLRDQAGLMSAASGP